MRFLQNIEKIDKTKSTKEICEIALNYGNDESNNINDSKVIFTNKNIVPRFFNELIKSRRAMVKPVES